MPDSTITLYPREYLGRGEIITPTYLPEKIEISRDDEGIYLDFTYVPLDEGWHFDRYGAASIVCGLYTGRIYGIVLHDATPEAMRSNLLKLLQQATESTDKLGRIKHYALIRRTLNVYGRPAWLFGDEPAVTVSAISQAEYIRDPAAAMELLRSNPSQSLTLTDEDGEPAAIISVPRDKRPCRFDEHRDGETSAPGAPAQLEQRCPDEPEPTSRYVGRVHGYNSLLPNMVHVRRDDGRVFHVSADRWTGEGNMPATPDTPVLLQLSGNDVVSVGPLEHDTHNICVGKIAPLDDGAEVEEPTPTEIGTVQHFAADGHGELLTDSGISLVFCLDDWQGESGTIPLPGDRVRVVDLKNGLTDIYPDTRHAEQMPAESPGEGARWVRCYKAADQTASGRDEWRWEPVDVGVADIVERLQGEDRPFTASACDGHGRGPAEVLLADGRTLVVLDPSAPPAPSHDDVVLALRRTLIAACTTDPDACEAASIASIAEALSRLSRRTGETFLP